MVDGGRPLVRLRRGAHPYAEFLHRVDKPARYTGGEVGLAKRDWSSVEARVCLAFPDVYDIGMSHLGYKILYKVLNDDPRTLAERAYCPWIDMEAELRSRGLPLVSLESYRPLSDFDVVGFSLQYELTFSNLLTMLDLGGIPLRAADRTDSDPLVVGGGPNATHPEPVAPFFDAIVIGDGEAKLTELALAWTRLGHEGASRQERLEALARLGGIYVPSLYDVELEPDTGLMVVADPARAAGSRPARDLPFPIERTQVRIDDYPFPDDGPTGGPEAIFDRTSIEITRGCTEGCRFCQAGMIYRPVQERDPAQVIQTVRRAVERSGNDEVSLTALSTADVSYIYPLIKTLAPELAQKRVSLSVSSLRAYGLAPELLDELRRVRAGGLTFAPEAGTQRMRDVINKNVTEEQLLETAERVFSRGWQRMKLYFMIGLPTERDEDVEGIADTGLRTAAIGQKLAGKRAEVTVSVSTHVPKPHTPFQWAQMDGPTDIERKQQLLRERLRGRRGVKLRHHDARSSVLEGILARGDRRLADVIERAWRHGARYDSWDDQLRLDLWDEALAHHGINRAALAATLPTNVRLPWSHIDVGLEDGFLLREYRQALRDRLSPPCSKVKGAFIHDTNLEDARAQNRRLVCYDCGVACDLGAMRQERLVFLERLGAHARPPAADPAALSQPTARAPRGRPAPPTKGDPHAGHRYRLRFEKLGPASLLGHLDLVRELARVLRRLGVEQIHTAGFNPKPIMTFAPALALGVMSLDEHVDLRLARHYDEAALPALLSSMTSVSPEGLGFLDAIELGPGDAAVSKIIGAARYLLVFSVQALGLALGADRRAVLAERTSAVMAAETLPVMRRVKGMGKKVDVRPFLRALALVGHRGEALERAGIVGDVVAVEATVAIVPTGSVRSAEIAQLLFGGDQPPPHRAIRVELSSDGGISPMDLPSLRGQQRLAIADRHAERAALCIADTVG